MRHFATVSLVVAFLWLVASPALAQEYGPESGDLEVTLSLVVTFSGDGYAADSTVLLTLTQDDTDGAIDLGTLEVDSTGALSGSVTLPAGLSPGAYTLAATGLTEDGATRVLSAKMVIAGDVTTESTTTTTTTVAETTSTTSSTTTSAELPATVLRALLDGLEAVRITAAQ